VEAQITRLTPTAVRIVASTMHLHLNGLPIIGVQMASVVSFELVEIN
jgi:hypothetical protein